MPMPSSEQQSVETSVRKIKNGFILRQSTYDGKDYKTEETFHAKKPKVNISVEKPKA